MGNRFTLRVHLPCMMMCTASRCEYMRSFSVHSIRLATFVPLDTYIIKNFFGCVSHMIVFILSHKHYLYFECEAA